MEYLHTLGDPQTGQLSLSCRNGAGQCFPSCACMLQSNILCTAGLLNMSGPYLRHDSCHGRHGLCSSRMYCCMCDLRGPCRWGVTDEIKGQAEHLSKLNDVRVAVLDLYKGKIGVDAEEASHVSISQHPAAR